MGELVVIDRDTCELRRWLLDRSGGYGRLVPDSAESLDAINLSTLPATVRREVINGGPWIVVDVASR